MASLLLAALIGAEFMLQIVGTMMNVAVPNAQSDLALSVSTASWTLNGFFLAFAGFMLLGGRLGDVYGHRRMFLVGIGLLTVASVLAGLAPGIEVLIAGRVLQGLGAAIAAPTGLALLTVLFNGSRQKRALALYSTISAFGSGAGLVIGGVLTYLGDWRASLLISVPIGLLVIVVSIKTLNLANDTTEDRSLGLASSILVTAAMTTGILGLVRASQYGWSDRFALLCFAGFAALLVALLVGDSRAADPLLPLRVFTHRDRLTAFVNLVLIASVMGSLFFYLSVYLSQGLGFNSLQTGLGYLPYVAGIVAAAEGGSRVLWAVSLKMRGLVGLITMAVAVALLTQLDAHSSYTTHVLPQLALLGAGVGLAIAPLYTVIMATTAPRDSGITAGVLQVTINAGGTVGLAILLTPASAHGGAVTDNISSILKWATCIAVVNVAINAIAWFGPRTNRH
jgi:MFS family permease